MSKILYVVLMIAVISMSELCSQDIAELPDDPRIKKGKLDNGLSYYLVNNPYTVGYADIYLLQGTGTSVEDSTQKGMTSIIADMGIRSTRNFQGTTMLNYLNTKGIALNKNLSIDLNKESSRYHLANMPLDANKCLLDSSLLILFNWSCFITFDEEDVEKEKGYIRNALTKAEDVSLRLEKDYLRKLLKGTSYSPPVFNELLDSIAGYSSKNIRSYYYKWFRPDLQAIVIVGDINVTEVEIQIKSLFQAAPKGINPQERVYEQVEDNKELEVVISSDKEETTSKVRMMFKVDVIPSDLKESAVPYVVDYMNSMITYLIKERLIVLSRMTKFPIISHDVKYGNFFGIREKEALSVEIETDPKSVSDAIAFIVHQMENIRANGFSRTEFIRARDVFFDRLNYQYNWRNMADNRVYTDRCMHNFLDGGLLSSIELHSEYMEKVKQEINNSHLNAFVGSYIRQQGINSIITCSYPEKCSAKPLSASDVKELYQETISLESDVFHDEKIISKFIEKELTPGIISSQVVEPISKSLYLNLTNGAKVILKNIKNEPEKFRFTAISKGGLSLYKGDVSRIEPFINDIAAIGGGTQTSSTNLERLMMENDMSLSMGISSAYSELDGSAHIKDLRAFMELIHLNFMPKEEDVSGFERYKRNKDAQLEFAENNPKIYFKDPFADKRNLLKELNYSEVNKFVDKLYSNIADFTFIIVGDFNEEVMKAMVLKYIGSLPGDPNNKRTINAQSNIFKRKRFGETIHLNMEMEFPRYYYSLEIENEYLFNVDSKIMTDLISWLVTQRVIERMAIEQGILVEVNDSYSKYPMDVFGMEFSFITKTFSDSNISYLKEILYSISREGITKRELEVLKTIFKNKFALEQKADNSFWSELIVDRTIYGKDLYSKYLLTLEALEVEDVNEALSDFIDNGVTNIKTMSPK